MSVASSVTYRCPACSAPIHPIEERGHCPSCGFEGTRENPTFILTADTPTSAAGSQAPLNRFESRYELLEEIGRGGMGIVHRAIDRELDEVIAIKILAPAAGANSDLVERFKHEVKVARRLSHPSIARLHDLAILRGQLCLSMEYIEGESLRQLLETERFPPERVIRYIRALAPALDLAHQLGIVHRDLKPGNIVVDREDAPHILDFGIAKSEWLRAEDDSSVVGTPSYMAPEQWLEGADVDGRADLYSLGVLLYEMVCGRKPFVHKNRLMLMEMHRTRPPLAPRSLVSGIPERLERMILRLLEKDPDKRFARARDLLTALEMEAPREKSAATTGAGASPAPARRPNGSRRVLVADDDPGVRRILRQQLQEHGLQVLEAANGHEAVEQIFGSTPDLVLLDVRMPVLDGLEALMMVKSNPRTQHVPVVLMSGAGEKDHATFSREYGAASFLSKPLTSDVVELLIDRYFARV